MSQLDLLAFPDIVLEKILSYLSYDEIAHFRIVCKRLNTICKQLLNKGFIAAERCHSQSIKAVKVQLPRRESERRLHPLARHCDILTAIETRLSMLSMTFMKYVDVGLCCFIPGKVIDEIFKVLMFLKDCKSPPRAHEILQELRDISSMAMEHFDEKIAPAFKSIRSEAYTSQNSYGSQSQYTGASTGGVCGASTRVYFTQEKLRLEFQKNQRREQKYKRELLSLQNKVSRHKNRLTAQARKLSSQANLIAEQDTQIAEMKRTLTEWDHKYGDIVAELSCVREENAVLAAALGIVFNRTKSPQQVTSLVEPCTSRDGEGTKRKISDGVETSRTAKKIKSSKGLDISTEENKNANKRMLKDTECDETGNTSINDYSVSKNEDRESSLVL